MITYIVLVVVSSDKDTFALCVPNIVKINSLVSEFLRSLDFGKSSFEKNGARVKH